MGPFELLDLTGLDVSHPVMESLYRQYYDEPRFRPSPLAAQRMAAGLFGRKSGRGFYRYEDGQKLADTNTAAPSDGTLPQSVWIAEGPHRAHIAGIVDRAGVPITEHEAAELCVVPLLGEDASTAAVRLHLDARRTIGIDGVFGLDSHRTLVPSPATSAEARAAARGLFTADGVAASLIGDSPGAVAQRVLANIVNVACDIAQQRIASPADIDAAVMLGLGYPRGPLAWGDSIGPATVLRILETLQAITGDPRYRPSLWLRRRAQLHLSLLHDD
jgi:3-hydroxybutyryl-CoA dehydrogenase